MNVEIGTEAVQFPEKEYKNEIFVAVYIGNGPNSKYSMRQSGALQRPPVPAHR